MAGDHADRGYRSDSLNTLAVLIVNFGSHEIVERNVAQSVEKDFAGQVIVVDNYTTESERRQIREVCSRHGWSLIAADRNLGFGAANNLAAAQAIDNGATELLLLNPDAWLSLSTIRALQAHVRQNPETQVAPTVLRPDGGIYASQMDLHLHSGENRATRVRPQTTDPQLVHPWLSGACFAISAELWLRVGGFDDQYFLYWEDVDLSRRVVTSGGSLFADPTLHAFHDEGSTHRSGNSRRAKSATYYYFNARNRLLYAAKQLGAADRRRWMRLTPRATYRILLQGGRRQFVRPLRTLVPATRGAVAGLFLAARSQPKEQRPIRAMQSFGRPLPTTNPYITMLDSALHKTPGIEHLRFSWRRALMGTYDVFQWHWPEAKMHGSSRWKSAAKLLLSGLLVLRHRLSRRIAVVRTVHNIELPDDSRARLWLLRTIDRNTDYRIALNATTPIPSDSPHTVILHGHYRDWYGDIPPASKVPGRLGAFGGVRRYKGVSALVETYAGAVMREPLLSLHVGGNPSTADLADTLRKRAAELPGIILDLHFLSDEELVALATASELVVLSYRFMHNSGSVLAALSLDRPVLVPRHAPNEALAEEVGQQWVLMYDGELTSETLLDAWSKARSVSGSPDLSQRDWSQAGQAHADAFREAVQVKRERQFTPRRIAEYPKRVGPGTRKS